MKYIPDTDSFPVDNDGISSVFFHNARINPDGTIENLRTTPQEQEAAKQAVLLETRAMITSRSSTYVDNYETAVLGGYSYVDSGVLEPEPPVIYSDVNIKLGIRHPDFYARQAQGEIMMSSYERCVIRVRQTAGNCTTKYGTELVQVSVKEIVKAGIFTVHAATGVVFYKGMRYSGGDVSTTYFMNRYPEVSDWVYPEVVTADDIYLALGSRSYDYLGLVTNTLAKANRSSVDLLTAVAELPKTIESAIDLSKRTAHILKGFKRREFSLSKSYERRTARMTKSYQGRIRRIESELSKSTLSKSRRAALSKEKSRIELTHRDALKKTADELTSALADLWLNYRYNIMPNVYLAQDIYDARDQFERQFVTAKGTQRNEGSVQVGAIRFDVSSTLRCTIKRRFSLQSAKSGASVVSANIFTTAWELIPLSFVYDWFVNFGDNIAARSINFGWEQQMCSLADKCEFDSTLYDSRHDSCALKPKTHVSGFYYKRSIITPQDCSGLVWKPEVGLERKLDLLSLAWRPVRSLLLKGRN